MAGYYSKEECKPAWVALLHQLYRLSSLDYHIRSSLHYNPSSLHYHIRSSLPNLDSRAGIVHVEVGWTLYVKITRAAQYLRVIAYPDIGIFNAF